MALTSKCYCKQHARILTGLFLLALMTVPCYSQKRVPQFKDYPAIGKYNGKNAPVKLVTKGDRMYRTMLRTASTTAPNFAGHYIVATWGCGAQCLMGAIIDANTGSVYWIPYTICCWSNTDEKFEPVEARVTSRLIVFSGLRDEKDGDDGAHFYEFNDGKFIHIRSILKPNQ